MNTSEYSILIVDDDRLGREMVARRLEKAGYLTSTAADGHHALAMLAVESYDLVLLDLMMPRLDGFRVLESIMESELTRDIPVIVLTALGDRQSTARCSALGACDYLLKPIEIGLVKSRVWQAIESRRYARRTGKRRMDTGPAAGHLLLVEDDESNLDLIRRRAEKWGCTADRAGDGVEAMELLSTGAAYDLIMLDISMPKADGLEVLRFIRARQPLNSVPVVMVSAITDSATVVKCLKLGANDFVMKPFNAVELNIRIQGALRLRRILVQQSEREQRISELGELGASIHHKQT